MKWYENQTLSYSHSTPSPRRAMRTQKITRKIREEVPNMSNITQGAIFKDYKSLCLVLGVSVVQGNVKAAQLKEWKRYFELEKVPGTHKLRIIFIYPVTQPKESSKRKNIYLDDTKLRLLTLIASKRNETGLIIPRSRLAVELGLCNDNYNKYKYNLISILKKIYFESNPRAKTKHVDEFDVPVDEIYLIATLLSEKLDYEDFFQKSSNAINGWIKTLLANLKKDGLTTIEETYIIKHRGDSLSKEATPELKTKIDEIYDNLRLKHGIKDKNPYLLFRSGHYKKFTNDLNKELLDLGIEKHTKAYKFNFISGLDDIVSSYKKRYREGIQASERVNANAMARFSSTDKEKEIAELLIKKIPSKQFIS
jgi:hypothetical protein